MEEKTEEEEDEEVEDAGGGVGDSQALMRSVVST